MLVAIIVVLLQLANDDVVRAQQSYLEILPPRFDEASYAPGGSGEMTLAFRNTLPATPLELVSATVHFDWNASGEGLSIDFGDLPGPLLPGEVVDADLPFTVPQNTTEGTHSYSVEATYSYEFGSVPIVLTTSTGPIANLQIDGGGWPVVVWVSLAAVLASAALVGAGLFVRRGRPASLELGRFFRAAREVAGEAELPAGTLRAHAGAPVPLEAGAVYLFEERKPRLAFEAVRAAQEEDGRATLIVAREAPERLERLHGLSAQEILWLTYSHEPPAVEPTAISAITGRVYRFLEARPGSLLLFEGLEYLITQNNFSTVLRFLGHIRDAALRRSASLVLVADPRVLSIQERALLERDARIVIPEDEPEEPSAVLVAPPSGGRAEGPARS